MAFSLLLKLSKVWSHFSAAHDLTCYFLEFICSIHRTELSFFSIYFCTFDDTQDLLPSDVKSPSPPRLHQQFILLSLLSPTLYVRWLSFIQWANLLSKLAMVHSYRWLFSTSTQCSLVHCHLTSISTWSISTKQFMVATPVPTILKEGRENEKYIPCIQTYH